MPNFKKQDFQFSDKNERGSDSDFLRFSTQIKITSKGEFYTDLPNDVAEKFLDAGVLKQSYQGDVSYKRFKAKTYDDLLAAINKCGEDYLSKELISEALKIEFSIETTCHYAKDETGLFPNGYYIKNKEGVDYWRGGTTKSLFSSDLIEYGLQIYAKPFKESVYRYKSGKIFTKRSFAVSKENGLGENGQWLQNIIRQKLPQKGTLQEIEYSEEIAGFFRSFFESLFVLNERIQGMINPEQIKLLSSKGQKLIGNGTI